MERARFNQIKTEMEQLESKLDILDPVNSIERKQRVWVKNDMRRLIAEIRASYPNGRPKLKLIETVEI